jgi:hypothetical protein
VRLGERAGVLGHAQQLRALEAGEDAGQPFGVEFVLRQKVGRAAIGEEAASSATVRAPARQITRSASA